MNCHNLHEIFLLGLHVHILEYGFKFLHISLCTWHISGPTTSSYSYNLQSDKIIRFSINIVGDKQLNLDIITENWISLPFGQVECLDTIIF